MFYISTHKFFTSNCQYIHCSLNVWNFHVTLKKIDKIKYFAVIEFFVEKRSTANENLKVYKQWNDKSLGDFVLSKTVVYKWALEIKQVVQALKAILIVGIKKLQFQIMTENFVYCVDRVMTESDWHCWNIVILHKHEYRNLTKKCDMKLLYVVGITFIINYSKNNETENVL